MKVDHLILAKGSSVDRDTHSLSVFEMIEQMQIKAPKFPVNVPVHAIIVYRREKSEEGVLIEPWRLNVFDPQEKVLLSQNIEVKMDVEHSRQRVRINFPIQISSDGEYKVRVSHVNDQSETRELELDVKAITDIGPPPSGSSVTPN